VESTPRGVGCPGAFSKQDAEPALPAARPGVSPGLSTFQAPPSFGPGEPLCRGRFDPPAPTATLPGEPSGGIEPAEPSAKAVEEAVGAVAYEFEVGEARKAGGRGNGAGALGQNCRHPSFAGTPTPGAAVKDLVAQGSHQSATGAIGGLLACSKGDLQRTSRAKRMAMRDRLTVPFRIPKSESKPCDALLWLGW
jgi:hypothetical protein